MVCKVGSTNKMEVVAQWSWKGGVRICQNRSEKGKGKVCSRTRKEGQCNERAEGIEERNMG